MNEEQTAALRLIESALENPETHPPVLLHGVTGSGKTEVYLQAIRATLAHGKTAIVLVPEISLTPQTVERFKSRFAAQPDMVAVLHSHLSEGERHDEWHKLHAGRARIVIGARSAIFAPLENLGVIVVDEEHETSYKQEEAPRYHARDVAVVRAKLEKCAVVLGTATPSLESYHNAQSGRYELITQIGQGGMGAVYRARDTRLDRMVAIKVLPGHLARDAGVLAAFDPESSWERFMVALESDVGDVQGGTTQEGIHMGVMAGTLDLIQRGYLGTEICDGVLRFDPKPVGNLDGLSFPMQFRGTPLEVQLEGNKLTVAAQSDDFGRPIEVRVGDETKEIGAGESHTFGA